ncbi:uncharacterized protein KY384_008086 [Bacidia gigantensis]|uniref:uncharacterized protein n=1 Tax=Bacidia gigantensis TaxID=2732470 RepID=UPI001D04F169|nr:uncharacterized protein KY384_008086 [Bacidia gigantensis]KAG8526657.1 hypothetical protein KY384_008086 [Bacidia gigantensis]
MSDLHLEVGQQNDTFEIKPCAPYLILAGDIGRLMDYDGFRAFLSLQCEHFTQVYLIVGNHEFFGVSRSEGLHLVDKLQEEATLRERLIIMNRRRVDLPAVTVLGCTLQSFIPPEAEDIVGYRVNDFHHIKDWKVADHNAEHHQDVEWLKKEIKSIRDIKTDAKRKILVITHHAPSHKGTSNPAYERNAISSAFCTDLMQQRKRSPLDDVQWWVFGHTHYCMESTRGTVRLIANQRGYVFPNARPFRPELGTSFMTRMQTLLGAGPKMEMAFDPEKVINV